MRFLWSDDGPRESGELSVSGRTGVANKASEFFSVPSCCLASIQTARRNIRNASCKSMNCSSQPLHQFSPSPSLSSLSLPPSPSLSLSLSISLFSVSSLSLSLFHIFSLSPSLYLSVFPMHIHSPEGTLPALCGHFHLGLSQRAYLEVWTFALEP